MDFFLFNVGAFVRELKEGLTIKMTNDKWANIKLESFSIRYRWARFDRGCCKSFEDYDFFKAVMGW
jgi:hypothetical protein